MGHEEDIPPEEREKWNLDRERDADALKDYTKVERVIGKKVEEGDTKYLVKCKLSDHGNGNTILTQNREGTLLRFVHLGGWQPCQQYRPERDRPLPGSRFIITAIK